MLRSASVYAVRQGGRLVCNAATHAARNPVSTGMTLLALGEHYKQATGGINPAATAALHAVRGLGSVAAAAGLVPKLDAALAARVAAGGGVAVVASHPKLTLSTWQRLSHGAVTGAATVVAALGALFASRARPLR